MILKSLIFLHRWVGIVLCLVFLLWFPSGIGMMYWGFPGVSATDKLDHSPKLDPAKIMLSPTEAADKVGVQANPTQIRLNSFDGRPVYRITGGGGGRRGGGGGEGAGGGGRGRGGGRIVYADTGEEQTEVSSEMLDRLAAAWAGKPIAEAKKISVEEVDQWTVAGNLKTLRPMFKYTWPDGQQVYLNGMTGEVVQYTTFWTRVAAHVSAIPHWVYYTPLRQNQPVWINFMIYSSLIGTVGAIIGMIVAVTMYSPKQKYRLAGQPTGVPYRGQKRWHWIIGMVFGVATVTWTFSGLMSLGPFPLMQRLTGQTPRNERQQAPPQPPAQQQPPAQVAGQTPSAPAPPAQTQGTAPASTATDEPALVTPRRQRRPPEPSGETTPTLQVAQATGSQETPVAAQSQPADGTPQVQPTPQTEQGNAAVGEGGANRGQGGGGRGRGGRGGRRGGRGGGGQGRAPADGTPTVAGQPAGEQSGRGGTDRSRGQGGATPAATTAAAVADQGGRGQGGGQGGGGGGGGVGGGQGGGRGGGQQGIAGALRGRVRMSDFADVHPRDLLAKVPDLDVREIEYTSFASTPLVSANLAGGKTQLLSLDGKKIDGFDQKQVIDIVTNALPDPKTVEIRIVDQYDLYYFDRTRQRPLPVILALTHDADNTRYYIDPKSARVMTTYNDKNWVNRYLYTGLHSLNFPFLYNHRPLWDIVVISFMVGGTALCVTSLVLAWRVLGRKLKRAMGPPSDVLTAEG